MARLDCLDSVYDGRRSASSESLFANKKSNKNIFSYIANAPVRAVSIKQENPRSHGFNLSPFVCDCCWHCRTRIIRRNRLVLVSQCFIVVTDVHRALVTAHPIPGVIFCVGLGTPDYFFTYWIPTILFEGLLCSLAVFRGYQTYRSQGSPFHSGPSLVNILIRDSVLYFLV